MNVTIIGSGNVATHLAKALHKEGVCIDMVYSRSLENAEKLSFQVNAKGYYIDNEITSNADIIIISISDDAIKGVINRLNVNQESVIIHTSGSVDISVFKPKFNNRFGVLYPLQTFSVNRDINFKQIPLCIEACDTPTQQILIELAEQLSPNNVYQLNSNQRCILHLAAVFACNFTNAMYSIGNNILEDLDFDLLKPLILETAMKAIANDNPQTVQTGPAKRNDIKVIDKHIDMLSAVPMYQELYKIVSKIISEEETLLTR